MRAREECARAIRECTCSSGVHVQFGNARALRARSSARYTIRAKPLILTQST